MEKIKLDTILGMKLVKGKQYNKADIAIFQGRATRLGLGRYSGKVISVTDSGAPKEIYLHLR